AVVVDGYQRHGPGKHVGLVVLLIFLVVHGEAGVKQQPVALRPRPFGDRHETGRRRLDRRCLGRHVGRDAPMAPDLVLFVVVVGDLVRLAHLSSDTAREAADVAIVDTWAAGIGDVPEGRRVGIVEAVDDRLVDAQVPERPVEPHLVLNDGTAYSG